MRDTGLIAERRVWAGAPGLEVGVAAFRLEDGSAELETRYVAHGSGRPVVHFPRRVPLATAFWMLGALHDVVVRAAQRIELESDPDDSEERLYAEARLVDDAGCLRVVAAHIVGEPCLRIDTGTDQEEDLVLILPFARALEFRPALEGAVLVALASLQIPTIANLEGPENNE